MANPLRTVLIQNRLEAADRVFQEQLPTNPLSMLLFTIRALNATVDVTRPVIDLLNMINDVGVIFRGQDIVRGPLRELAIINARIFDTPPYGQLRQSPDNDAIAITVPVCLGRRPFLEMEAFPAVRQGDLVLELSIDVVSGNFDGLALQVETVQLLDAQPARYCKYVRNTHEFSTTGEERVNLPIGPKLLGVLLTGDTVPTAAARTATWEQLRLKIDDVEAIYARTNWDTLAGELFRENARNMWFLEDHRHRFNGAAAAFDFTLEPIRVSNYVNAFALMDFWPGRQDDYILPTAGRASVEIQRDAGTQDTGFFYPVELIELAGGGQ